MPSCIGEGRLELDKAVIGDEADVTFVSLEGECLVFCGEQTNLVFVFTYTQFSCGLILSHFITVTE